MNEQVSAPGQTVDAASKVSTETNPWVSDLHSSLGETGCQSTVGFDDHICSNSSDWYVELEILGYEVANPRWEGKLCDPCLAGWREWEAEEPDAIRLLSATPVVTG